MVGQFGILDILRQKNVKMTAKEIITETKLPSSAVHRIMYQLAKYNLVVREKEDIGNNWRYVYSYPEDL